MSDIHVDIDLEKALAALSRERLEEMRFAGETIQDCFRLLKKADQNVVGQCLAHQGTFYELDHYPKGDVYDSEHHAQYYYHAHRKESGEHGHFHTFLRASGIPADAKPLPYTGDEPWPQGDEALNHLIGISMSKAGFPVGLFAVNHWVTGGTWYAAMDVIRMLDLFKIDHAYPSWPVNRWISAMIRFYYPQIAELLDQRDRVIEAWAEKYPGEDVYRDLELEITGRIEISDEEQFEAVNRALVKVS